MKLFVRLLDEGTEVFRPVEATDLGGGLYRILPFEDAVKDDEVWEFPPGSVVRTEVRCGEAGEYAIAVKP
jgi:hypothetical protein